MDNPDSSKFLQPIMTFSPFWNPATCAPENSFIIPDVFVLSTSIRMCDLLLAVVTDINVRIPN